jgi:quinol monooxygenase YgiN
VLIVSGHLRIAAGHRDAFAEDSAPAVVQARATDGCLDFVVAADRLDPDRVNVYERWTDAEALLAFRGSGPSDAHMEHVTEAAVRRYEIASEGPA